MPRLTLETAGPGPKRGEQLQKVSAACGPWDKFGNPGGGFLIFASPWGGPQFIFCFILGSSSGAEAELAMQRLTAIYVAVDFGNPGHELKTKVTNPRAAAATPR